MSIELYIGKRFRQIADSILDFPDSEPIRPLPARNTTLLYVHVPFCHTLCPFCTFHRVRLDADKAARYFDALRAEITLYANHGFRFSDVYIGGGTPTVVPTELLRTLALIRTIGVSGKISVETNPDHLRPEILQSLRAAGVNRLSVGVQSFDDRLLAEMGRLEPYGSGDLIARRLAEARGQFDTLNADLIFNIPHQTLASLHQDIAILRDVGIDQVSYYPLMPAPATRRAMSRNMGSVDFAREKRLYLEIHERLQPFYVPSSAWCFSRGAGLIDEYIVDHDEYLGVGSGAFSYVNGTMSSTTFSINSYIKRVAQGQTGIVLQRVFHQREQLFYALLVGMFGLTVSRMKLIDRFGADSVRSLWKELLFLRTIGAIKKSEDAYHLTERGMYLWVVMMREFLMSVNRLRGQLQHHIRREN